MTSKITTTPHYQGTIIHNPSIQFPYIFPDVPNIQINNDPDTCNHPYLRVSNTNQCFDCKTYLDSKKYANKLATEQDSIVSVNKEDAISSSSSRSHSTILHQCGVTIEWLLAFTNHHNLWNWPTWKVNRLIIKPATQKTRCRYSHLPEMKEHIGPANVFLSHCWGAPFGDVVACAVRTGSIVWLDLFAVRQWPGREADLCFQQIVKRCNAIVVSVSVNETLRENPIGIDALITGQIDSQHMKLMQRTVSLCRLWCILEIFGAIMHDKPIVVRYGSVIYKDIALDTLNENIDDKDDDDEEQEEEQEEQQEEEREETKETEKKKTKAIDDEETIESKTTATTSSTAATIESQYERIYETTHGLQLIQYLIDNIPDVRDAACSSETDKQMHLSIIEKNTRFSFNDVNIKFQQAMLAAVEATIHRNYAIETAFCGNLNELNDMMQQCKHGRGGRDVGGRDVGGEIVVALRTCIMSGQLIIGLSLISCLIKAVVDDLSVGVHGEYRRCLYFASLLNQVEMCRALLKNGIHGHQVGGMQAETALSMAVQNENSEIVNLLLEHGATFDMELDFCTHWYDPEPLNIVWDIILKKKMQQDQKQKTNTTTNGKDLQKQNSSTDKV